MKSQVLTKLSMCWSLYLKASEECNGWGRLFVQGKEERLAAAGQVHLSWTMVGLCSAYSAQDGETNELEFCSHPRLVVMHIIMSKGWRCPSRHSSTAGMKSQVTTGCYRHWNHSSCSCVISKAHAKDSLLCLIIHRKPAHCLLSPGRFRILGQGQIVLFFPQLSGFQLSPPVAVSDMLTHLEVLGIFVTLTQIITEIVDTCMKKEENASS